MKLNIKLLDVELTPGDPGPMAGTDRVDRIREQWSRERPDLDSGGFAIAGRLLLLGKLFERRVTDALRPLGLQLWAFDVLATLRRQGPPYRLTPTELSRATMLTTGAMTHRLDRLESEGLIRREPDPDDRRGVRVVLTEQGVERVDRGIEARFEEARAAVAVLPAGDRRALEGFLRRLLVDLDAPRSGPDDEE